MSLFAGLGEALGKASKVNKKDRLTPKTMVYVLKYLINDIDQYISEVLDPYFIEKKVRYQRHIKEKIADHFKKKGVEVSLLSAATTEGVDDLKQRMRREFGV